MRRDGGNLVQQRNASRGYRTSATKNSPNVYTFATYKRLPGVLARLRRINAE